MDIIIHTSIKQKIEERHRVTEKEVEECFLNRDGNFLYDTREKITLSHLRSGSLLKPTKEER